MAITYLKRAQPRPHDETSDLRDLVATMLTNIESKGEDSARE